MKFRKKPVEIDAIQWTGENKNELWPLFEDTMGGYIDDSGQLNVRTLEGTMRADVGDWIIKGVAGEVYPCKPDIFERTYDVMIDLVGSWCRTCDTKCTPQNPCVCCQERRRKIKRGN